MKRVAPETLWMLAACAVYALVYFTIERQFGGEGKWVLVVVALVAVAGYVFLRRRSEKRD